MQKFLIILVMALCVSYVLMSEHDPVTREEVAEASQPAGTIVEAGQEMTLNQFFQKVFDRDVAESPIFQGYLGIKKDYHKWDDLSEAQQKKEYERTVADLAYMRDHYDFDSLSAADQQSYRIFEILSQRNIDYYENWRYHNYPLNQMFGWQSEIPSFLITVHTVDSMPDAEDYITRLNGIKPLMSEVINGLKTREQKGVMPPKFVYTHLDGEIGNLLSGKPLDNSDEDHPLYADFKKKVNALELDDAMKADLIKQAEKALKTSFQEAYLSLKSFLADQSSRATTDAGVWKFPNGGDFYNFALSRHTTTDLTADQIHELGLSEVKRIHDEMRTLIQTIGFKGTLKEFFEHSKTSEKFRYPETEASREDYLKKAHEYLAGMNTKLPQFFNTLPKAPVEIRPVEKFREKTAGIGFYQPATPDGSRPGYFYVNLYKMEDVPRTEIEALVYHETSPGHHMQISIAQELDQMPEFRKHANFTAYSEGWGLYSELLGKDMGFYQDPYSDFGRLTMELWRAIRLVTDTGVHAKKWTREQAIEYIKDNYPASEGEATKAIERYIVMPGQATAYKIGMLKILEARTKAHKELGDAFSWGEFHDAVLKSGAVPLNVMEANVQAWADSKKAAAQ